MNNAIILLSGGLDSVVCLALERNNFDKILALTFNYGQKAYEAEKNASEKIAKYYNIEHKIIDLPWLNDISNSSLNTSKDIPILKNKDLDDTKITKESAKSVWVPNRNGLFVNIAACYADAENYNTILIGANKEEAKTFKDNSKEFLNTQNVSFTYSVNKKIELTAPLIEMTKDQIVQTAINHNVPFELLHSCYLNEPKNCGNCESCLRLKRALKQNNRYDIIDKIFKR